MNRTAAAFEHFIDQGLAGPIRLFSPQQCRQFLKAARDKSNPPPLNWSKGSAIRSRWIYEIATQPPIIDAIKSILGENILLWGASIQVRRSREVHPWHCDIEAVDAPGKTVSVWIGLENANQDSSVHFIPYSHRFPITVQEASYRHQRRRQDACDAEVLRWAQELDRRSYLAKPAVADGEGLFFDSRIWHYSHNLFDKTRRALLLQYATVDASIRIPNINALDWPFERLEVPRPACLMVAGRGNPVINRIVPAPVALGERSLPQLTGAVHPLKLPLAPDPETGWKLHPIFSGATAGLRQLSCHLSVLDQKRIPHPPHTHDEEEILLLLTGAVDIILPQFETGDSEHRLPLVAGEMAYYPANFPHTLQTVSRQPANYLMFKWRNGAGSPRSDSTLGFGRFKFFDSEELSHAGPGFRPRLIFEGPTDYLGKFHCHATTLSAGAGYEPHADAYDVAIVVLQGEIETLNQRVGAHGAIFYAGGEPHGMHNPGDSTASYVVFEFHGNHLPPQAVKPKGLRRLTQKLTDSHYWKRKLRRAVARFSKNKLK